MAFGNIPKDAGGIPLGTGYVYGDAFYALQSGRKLTDGSSNALSTLMVSPTDGIANTYSAGIVGLAPITTAPTDIFTVTGSASKTVRITHVVITVSGTVAAGVILPFTLLKRSSADLTGTSTSRTIVPHDANNAAGSATVLAYTVPPGTLGTLVGAYRNYRMEMQFTAETATDFPIALPYVEDFGLRPSSCPVLRGTGEVFAINLNAIAVIAGWLFDISVEWTEDNS